MTTRDDLIVPESGEQVDFATVYKIVANPAGAFSLTGETTRLISQKVPIDELSKWISAGWSTVPPRDIDPNIIDPEVFGGGTTLDLQQFGTVSLGGVKTSQFGPKTEGVDRDLLGFQSSEFMHADNIVFTNMTDIAQSVVIGGKAFVLDPGGILTYGQVAPLLGLPIPPSDTRFGVNLTRNEFDRETAGMFPSLSGQPQDPLLGFFDDLLTSLSAGRGGGRIAAQYVAPDRRLVEDAIKSRLVALVGQSDPSRIAMLSDLYLQEHRRAFDSKDVQLDPMTSVQDKIRLFDDYQAIHRLRPETADEFQWVSQRVGALLRAGVTETDAQTIGIEQAKAGATTTQAARAGEIATLTGQRRVLPGFLQDMQTTARSALELL
jgi:hypothetical protein